MSIPAAPSPEALLLRAKLEALNPPPVDPATIPRRRRIMQIAYEPRVQRALMRFQPEIAETVIAGVRCLDIISPGKRGTGTILYCFGGGHVGGEPRQDLPINAALAEYTGARIIAPHVRLAPEHPWPAALEDVLGVYQDLVSKGGLIAVVGESAGGNLVLAMLLRAYRLGIPMPAAAALMSPWCDLTDQGDPSIADAGLDPTLNTQYLNVAATLYAGTADRDTPEISPLFADFDATFPPTLITTGTHDRLRGDCVALAAKLEKAGVAVDLAVWPGLWHVFEFYDELPEADASLRSIAGFLRTHLAVRSR